LIGFLGYVGEQLLTKILLTSWAVKGKIGVGISFGFKPKNEDLRLYSRMVLEIRQSLSTGRKYQVLGKPAAV
jgi:hypothetical protein